MVCQRALGKYQYRQVSFVENTQISTPADSQYTIRIEFTSTIRKPIVELHKKLKVIGELKEKEKNSCSDRHPLNKNK